jgi:excinuclease ABC subunit B
MSEDLTSYYKEIGIKVRYLHSDIDTLERMEIIRDLRQGEFDVLVGINLLREGLDLPEVSLIAILDADKEGFLRSETALIQTIGRAARNLDGRVIMYGDNITGSMQRAIDETNRRRKIQEEYNRKHNIKPKSIIKNVKEVMKATIAAEEEASYGEKIELSSKVDVDKRIKQLDEKMMVAASKLEFEKAAKYRDEINELKKIKKRF